MRGRGGKTHLGGEGVAPALEMPWLFVNAFQDNQELALEVEEGVKAGEKVVDSILVNKPTAR